MLVVLLLKEAQRAHMEGNDVETPKRWVFATFWNRALGAL